MGSFTLLRLVVSAIAAPELVTIYGDAFQREDTPAVELIESSLEMQLSKDFPGGLIKISAPS